MQTKSGRRRFFFVYRADNVRPHNGLMWDISLSLRVMFPRVVSGEDRFQLSSLRPCL